MNAVPIVCPQCGAAYHQLKLAPGSAFACGECGHTLHTPGAQPSASPSASALPVVAPTRGPKIQPKPGMKAPVVAPKTRGVVQPKRGPGGAKPKIAKPPLPGRAAPAAAAPIVTPKRPGTPTSPPRTEAAEGAAPRAMPSGRRRRTTAGSRRAPGSAAQAAPEGGPPAQRPRPGRGRRTTRSRPATKVISEADLGRHARPEKKSKALLYAGIFGAVCILTLVGVIVATSGNSESDTRNSYVAGYEGFARGTIARTFKLPASSSDEILTSWQATYGGEVILDSFYAGMDDAKRGSAPQHGGEETARSGYDADYVIQCTKEAVAARGGDGDANWQTAELLTRLMDRWKRSSNPAAKASMSKLEKTHSSLVAKTLSLSPDHTEAREASGEVKYDGSLASYEGVDWLDEGQRGRAKDMHARLTKVAAENGGYIKKTDVERINSFKATIAKKEEAAESLEDSEFGKKAMAMREEVLKDIQAKLEKGRENIDKMPAEIRDSFGKRMQDLISSISLVPVIRKPYVIFVQEDKGWDETLMAETQVLGPLGALNTGFNHQYRDKLGIEDKEEPIPVIYFREADDYQGYLFASQGRYNPGILAHFEPENGRLFVNGQTTPSTVMHEGTHQIFWFHATQKPEFKSDSYWFQEGVAEWFSGIDKEVGKDGEWVYEFGMLQQGRFAPIRFFYNDSMQYKLEELIRITYGDRGKQVDGRRVNDSLVYAQGWSLIYFLNYFKTTEDGYVLVDTKEKRVRGKYADVWDKLVEYALKGKDGKPHIGEQAFLDAAGVSSLDDLATMSEEFDRYQRWMLHKFSVRHTKDKRFLPWDKYRNKRQEKTGIKDDDLLPKPTDWSKRKKKDEPKKDGEGK